VVPHVVNAGQGDELVLVAHRAQFALELGDGGIVQVLLPVERRRAVVGQHLAGELGVNGFGEFLGEVQIRRAGFAPHQVGVGRVGQTARNGLIQTLLGLVEAFDGALAGAERLVVLVAIAGQQVGRFGIGAGRRPGSARRTRRQPSGRRSASAGFLVGTSTLPPMWPHFLTEASWSSKCTPAAPARIIAFISSWAFSTPPKPASASPTMGRK
jgi:hypothetical protein